MRFSQRIGITPLKFVQKEEMDNDLKNSLWNAIYIVYFQNATFDEYFPNQTEMSSVYGFIRSIWIDFFKRPADEIPWQFNDATSEIKSWLYTTEWFRLLDFIEFCAKSGPSEYEKLFPLYCNGFLERENSAYRFVNGLLAEITSEEEISAVETAIESAVLNGGAKRHLRTALGLMSDKTNPDYRNSIKESISAVESVAKQISGHDKATLGEALTALERTGRLHKALKNAFSSLYGYTSDADGIRHALMEDSSLTKADARFMLVSCSAFTNYLVELTACHDMEHVRSE
ncbi:AbiJ-NTD4 domain-containing protein [Parathalassolituus penaei]|uniref:HEPN AbiJ-N-terminal domain-containing protein n=1 Tax=Parathalassolituus penaei TaxID=2997323 RepID=A0A9X3IUK0_9GAMM|nr:hypothetical protein [Parathalassolituus penaei]MCY0967445.1 hypothetical protein [Parathalassolituus penaei]